MVRKALKWVQRIFFHFIICVLYIKALIFMNESNNTKQKAHTNTQNMSVENFIVRDSGNEKPIWHQPSPGCHC